MKQQKRLAPPLFVPLGPQDFNRFRKGGVLVARTSSPIWTPLFGIAAAAIT